MLSRISPFFLLSCRTMSTVGTRKLEGKVAVITASTDGIGYAIADRLAKDGAKIMISSRKQVNVDRAVDTLRTEHGNEAVAGIVCHVGKDEDRKNLISEAISRFGQLHILVSNAAVNPTFGPTLETPEAAWDKIFEVNVKSAAMIAKEAYPHLKKTSGNIVFVSSIGGYEPFNFLGPYSVSKTALFGLTKVLADELAPDNIRVNCLAPGVIKTRFSETLWKNDMIANEALKKISLNRFGEPADCAGAVSFMVSDDACYMTGETVVIGGGMKSRL
ncbi:PREDICTED: dehydrogenase/reductase SDR family member 4-like [Amphimedon queenslandica]|uniref:Dehydrogenase/reductase SDR family member 4 n=1 Tax=Amphimedon queenslandica TaxID=400682 RepID=A0A1X7VWG8_AMPQE|nr:PREDICTED: dehydrogenase/reductase SDR family member 4-like [Amphimedon queenslandica]|eukprot:XP_003382463.2 PREDICTED: dehydrogenase/reductase SDR family member 4-like [Amphimedon queenslandica]